jgi:hypothetical protein
VTVYDHTDQLHRVGNETFPISERAHLLGKLSGISRAAFLLDFIVLGFAAFHLAKGATDIAIALGAIEFVLAFLHVLAIGIERQLWRNHEDRLGDLREELREKRRDLIIVAETHSLQWQQAGV